MPTSKSDSTKGKGKTAKSTGAASAAGKSGAEGGSGAPRKASNALMKPVQPSDVLAAVVGKKAMPRTEVTKKVWEYIKSKNLQNPQNKRMIKADDKLRPVFGGKDEVSMFEMTKLVNEHLK